MKKYSIGIFDSGYGGLTVLKEIVDRLPQYDYKYIGDNARSPYGTRSFETVYKYTLQAVEWLFNHDCHLIIIACNTASAKALRTIQQKDLPSIAPDRRVLGVIRPVTEIIGKQTRTNHIGIFATPGTVKSNSYVIEIAKSYPEIVVNQEACPIWVPLVENNEFNNDGASYFIQKHIRNLLGSDPMIDAIILGCTHYPVMQQKIREYIPENITLVNQGAIVSESLADYLSRHPEIESCLGENGKREFYTTDSEDDFNRLAKLFYGANISSTQIALES